jgi:hypothetical protein
MLLQAKRFLILDLLLVLVVISCKNYSPSLRNDWLIDPSPFKAVIAATEDGHSIELSNGLIRRTIRLIPNAATVDFRNLMTGESIIRAVRPEAVLEIDGQKINVGGLEGQEEQAYLLPEWIDSFTSDPDSFQLAGFKISETKKRLEWKRKRWSSDLPWPPPGKSLVLSFNHLASHYEGLAITVHYEIYDGIPLLCKWIEILNGTQQVVHLNSFITETLAVVEPEASVGIPEQWDLPNIHVESDYAFNGMTPKSANQTVFWVDDPSFTSQVNYQLKTPCVLECRPPLGPDMDLPVGESFNTFRVFELIFDGTDKERIGLTKRRMYRTVVPWTTENPIFMHLTSTDPEVIRSAVDQCVEVGFEMVILSFGSGLNMESADPGYIQQIKKAVDYAHERGIELGGYSLLASRRISDEHDVINPATGKPGGAIFGNSPCLGSEWGIDYFKNIKNFIEQTGFDILEHDGSYPGDVCASSKHPGHKGLNDSQWVQWKKITDFYKWSRARGVYLNVPDWYFLSGSNKTAIGYREVNWSLPCERQIMLGRQNIYDGTWYKTPSMGWTFVPLVEYHGGGEAATLEPLSEHLDAYASHLIQNFGSGIQACYRGPRLFDTDKTKSLVKDWVEWYKMYRNILNSDIIHVRRPDGKDLDCILHVNPRLKIKGLAMVFNPTKIMVEKDLVLPLYYTGLTETARIRERGGKVKKYKLDREYRVKAKVKVPPEKYTWLLIQ